MIASYLLGWFLPYRYIIWVNLAVCLTYASLMMTVTETPIYLLRMNRLEDATRAIAYYRGVSISSKVVLDELSKLKQQINVAVELLPTVISPSTRRAMIIVALLIGLQNTMGGNAVQVYAKEVFRQSAPKLSSNLCSVLLAVVILLGNIMSGVLSDRLGRRFLLMTSCLGSLVCLVVMGVQVQISFAPAWLSAVLCLCYNFIFSAGAGTVPFLLIAEVFIPEVQSLAAMIQIISMWLSSFVLLYIFPFMVKFLGMYGTYYVFAVASVACFLVSYFLVPETKGLSNAQIQLEFLRSRKKSRKNISPGLDGIPGRVWVLAIKELEPQVLSLMTNCLVQGRVPRRWKTGKLVLLRKAGKPEDQPSAYRPIVLLDEICKVLERILAARLSKHLENVGPNLSENHRGKTYHEAVVRATAGVAQIVRQIRGLGLTGPGTLHHPDWR
ncbi:facilitated trehalose transporter Tret1-like [Aricia agestis]|uniref:facilitated trehalose transporter Tret1-like n=1 Tax=Aricia agestis TaxID=91739 RepID=UPI001C20205C|nr:facilitated trehalose transporter Tret1-like [Aricia agestis]